MTTIDKRSKKSPNRFWVIALATLIILAITTTAAEIIDTKSRFVEFLTVPSFPGFFIYVLVTGDIHGWQPGPIGRIGRIVVVTLGSWIFWIPLIYWIYRKIKKGKRLTEF